MSESSDERQETQSVPDEVQGEVEGDEAEGESSESAGDDGDAE